MLLCIDSVSEYSDATTGNFQVTHCVHVMHSTAAWPGRLRKAETCSNMENVQDNRDFSDFYLISDLLSKLDFRFFPHWLCMKV